MNKSFLTTIFLTLVLVIRISEGKLNLMEWGVSHNYLEEDVEAYHFHTYFFEFNPRNLRQALDFRKATRARINDQFLDGCSLNQIVVGVDGPHPYSQWELCCNKSSFSQAMAWHMKNRGGLSVMVHPLTLQDLEDHRGRAAWLGQSVPLDMDSPFLYPILETPRPCPIYPNFPDDLQQQSPRQDKAVNLNQDSGKGWSSQELPETTVVPDVRHVAVPFFTR